MYVLSHVWLFSTSWTVACQAPLSMKFFRQEYWSGFPFAIPRDLPHPGIEPAFPALAGRFFATSATCEAHKNTHLNIFKLEKSIPTCKSELGVQQYFVSMGSGRRESHNDKRVTGKGFPFFDSFCSFHSSLHSLI